MKFEEKVMKYLPNNNFIENIHFLAMILHWTVYKKFLSHEMYKYFYYIKKLKVWLKLIKKMQFFSYLMFHNTS